MLQTITRASRNPIEQSDKRLTISELFSAVEEENIDAFSKNIKNVDIDAYFDFEGTQVLLSGFLLSFLINPDIKNGEKFIEVVLARQPNFNLPIADSDSAPIYSEALKIARQDFIAELANFPDREEALNICLDRIDLIMGVSSPDARPAAK